VSVAAKMVQSIGFQNGFKMVSSGRLQSRFRWSKSGFRWRMARA
jgi:hypothetical protein